jgi:hypothetical protein
LLSCSCAAHRRSFFSSRILCGLCASRLIRVLSGRFTGKATEEINVREQHAGSGDTPARVTTLANKHVLEPDLCIANSLTRYADAPERNCRKDTPRWPCSKPPSGATKRLLVSWKTRAGGMQSNCPLLARDPGLVSHLPGTQSGPADSLIRKRSARVCLSIIAALMDG